MEQRLAAGEDDVLDAGADDAQHVHRLLPGQQRVRHPLVLRESEVLAVRAVQIAIARDVIGRDHRSQNAIRGEAGAEYVLDGTEGRCETDSAGRTESHHRRRAIT